MALKTEQNLQKNDKIEQDYIIDKTENFKVNYNKIYLKSIKELSMLMNEVDKNLPNVTSPTLIIQAKSDPVVNPESGKIIYEKIGSKNKDLLIQNSNHHLITKNNKNHLYEKIEKFIRESVKNI